MVATKYTWDLKTVGMKHGRNIRFSAIYTRMEKNACFGPSMTYERPLYFYSEPGDDNDSDDSDSAAWYDRSMRPQSGSRSTVDDKCMLEEVLSCCLLCCFKAFQCHGWLRVADQRCSWYLCGWWHVSGGWGWGMYQLLYLNTLALKRFCEKGWYGCSLWYSCETVCCTHWTFSDISDVGIGYSVTGIHVYID